MEYEIFPNYHVRVYNGNYPEVYEALWHETKGIIAWVSKMPRDLGYYISSWSSDDDVIAMKWEQEQVEVAEMVLKTLTEKMMGK